MCSSDLFLIHGSVNPEKLGPETVVRRKQEIDSHQRRQTEQKQDNGRFRGLFATPAQHHALMEKQGENDPDDNGNDFLGIPADDFFPGEGSPQETGQHADRVQGKPDARGPVVGPVEGFQRRQLVEESGQPGLVLIFCSRKR